MRRGQAGVVVGVVVVWMAWFTPVAQAQADWTGDGAGDVIAVNSAGAMYVYEGSGSGLFTDAGERIDGSGDYWGQFRDVFSTPDFTGDGNPDVFVRTTDGGLRIYRGNGAGGFVDDGTLIGNGWGGFVDVIAPGDFNSDGIPDVLARSPQGAIWLYRGNGDGGFVDNGVQVGGSWQTFTGFYAAGDFSGDGKPDVFARTSTGGLRLYRGSGTGGFVDSGTQPGGGWNNFNVILGVGDFTGDGKGDVLGRTNDGYLLVYRGNGAGSFADNGTVIGGGWNAFTAIAAAADFSGDGKPDILARLSDGTLRLLRGNGVGGLLSNGEPAGNAWATVTDLMAPGDFSGDGLPDLLARMPDGTMRLHRGDGDGGFVQTGTVVGTGWQSLTAVIAPGDFSGDGKPDVLARTADGAMRMYRGSGAGSFIDNGVQIGGGWNGFTDILPAGDFDNDDDPDLFGRTADGRLYLYRGTGAGGFADNGTLLGYYWDNFNAITSGGDFSGDGIPDVLARNALGELKLYRGNGYGSFMDNGVQPGAGWNAFQRILLVAPDPPATPFTTSVQYGGADYQINQPSEVNAVRAAIAALSVAQGDAMWWAIAPAERRFIHDSGNPTQPQQMCREAFWDGAGDDYADFCLHRETDDDVPTAQSSQSGGGYGGLNDEEIDFCTANLNQANLCGGYYDDKNEAYKLTEKLYSRRRSLSDATMANAFQHGAWLALMVNTDEDQPGKAWEYGVAHEGHEYDNATGTRRKNSRMDIINNHVGHKIALDLLADDELTDVRLCRSMFNRVLSGLYIDPDIDPREEYFARGLAPEYHTPVWRKIKTRRTHKVVRSLNIDDCEIADD